MYVGPLYSTHLTTLRPDLSLVFVAEAAVSEISQFLCSKKGTKKSAPRQLRGRCSFFAFRAWSPIFWHLTRRKLGCKANIKPIADELCGVLASQPRGGYIYVGPPLWPGRIPSAKNVTDQLGPKIRVKLCAAL